MIKENGAGNHSRFWNEGIVFEACRVLVENGTVPTVTAVRKQTGIDKGSDSTVFKYIRKFKEKAADLPGPLEAPEPLQTAINSLWAQAIAFAQAELQHERDLLNKSSSEMREEISDIESRLLASERVEHEIKTQNERLTRDLEAAGSLMKEQSEAISDLTSRVASLESDIDHASRELAVSKRIAEQNEKEAELWRTNCSELTSNYQKQEARLMIILEGMLLEHLDRKIVDQVIDGLQVD